MDNNSGENTINFQQRKNILLKRKEEAEKLLNDAIKKYDKIANSFSLRKEIKLKSAENIMQLREKNLNVINTELKYLRPRNIEDMEYRQRQYNNFSNFITKNIPNDLPLRFHGSPLHASKEIILSGELSSYGDRIGVEMSYDTPNIVYVNTKDNIFNTVRNFCNLTYDYDTPAGCLFVVTPKDEQDEISGHNQTMESIYFKNNPDRLVAVVSTPENVSNLKGWMKESNLPEEKVFDYDGFCCSIDKIIDSVFIPYKDLKMDENMIDKRIVSNLDSMISNAKNKADEHNKNVYDIKDKAYVIPRGRDK